MILSDDNFNEIERLGRFNIPARRVALSIGLSREDRDLFLFLFDDPDSDIRIAYERGRTKAEIEVMESLENFSMTEQEGAGEAAKALGDIKRRQTINQLKSDLFGL